MPWTLAGKTIRPGDRGDARNRESLYAVQQVLDATVETISYFGAASERRTLRFILFEDDNSNTGFSGLTAALIANADVALVSDAGAEGNYRMLSFKADRVQDHANVNNVYDCTVELIKV